VFAGASCDNSNGYVSVLATDTIHLQNCDTEPVCQVSCSGDIPKHVKCDPAKDPTPAGAAGGLAIPYSMMAYIDKKLGVQNQWFRACGENGDPTRRMKAGMEFLRVTFTPEKVNALLKPIPSFFLAMFGVSKTRLLQEVKAGTDLLATPEFTDYWTKMGRKCSKATVKLSHDRILNEFFTNKWVDQTILGKIKLINDTGRYPEKIVRLLEDKLKESTNSIGFRWEPKNVKVVFWAYSAYLANERAACRCSHVIDVLKTGKYPDGTVDNASKNPGVVARLENLARDACLSKFTGKCLPVPGTNTLETDLETDTEGISNAG
jgi:hypothetical protein